MSTLVLKNFECNSFFESNCTKITMREKEQEREKKKERKRDGGPGHQEYST